MVRAPFYARKRFGWKHVIAKSIGYSLGKYATPDARAERLTYIARGVLDVVLECKVTKAVVAGHALGQHGAMTLERAELVGVIKSDLFTNNIPIVGTPPDTAARKLLLGVNPALKAKEIAHDFLKAAGACFETEDEYDGFIFANWGLAELGHVALALDAR